MAPGKEGGAPPSRQGLLRQPLDFRRTSLLHLSRGPQPPVSEVGSSAPSGLGPKRRLRALRGVRGQHPKTRASAFFVGLCFAGQETTVVGGTGDKQSPQYWGHWQCMVTPTHPIWSGVGTGGCTDWAGAAWL